MTTPDYRLEAIDPEDLTSRDLREEALALADTEAEAYRVHFADGGETAELVWYGSPIFRGGLAWGADAEWTGAADPVDAVRRVIEDEVIV